MELLLGKYSLLHDSTAWWDVDDLHEVSCDVGGAVHVSEFWCDRGSDEVDDIFHVDEDEDKGEEDSNDGGVVFHEGDGLYVEGEAWGWETGHVFLELSTAGSPTDGGGVGTGGGSCNGHVAEEVCAEGGQVVDGATLETPEEVVVLRGE